MIISVLLKMVRLAAMLIVSVIARENVEGHARILAKWFLATMNSIFGDMFGGMFSGHARPQQAAA